MSTEEREIVFGLIGAGRIGKLHAENLVRRVDGARLKAVSDLKAEELETWANQLDISRLSSDPSSILEDPDIEAVAICSGTDTHADWIIRSAQAGKQIFCEKPIGNDVSEIRDALQAVDEAGVKLMIGFNRRFDRNFLRIQRAVRDGEIGAPQVLKITSRDPEPPPLEYVRVSGGLFFDMSIHDWDMARYVLGQEVEEVYASGGVLIDEAIGEAGDIDTAVAVLRFQSGALGLIDNCRQAIYGYDQRVEVLGSEGCIVAGNENPNTAVVMGRQGNQTDPIPRFFMDRYVESYLEEMRAFVRCLREEGPSPCGGMDGLQAVLIAKAAQKSLQERRPVRLQELNDS